MDLVRSDAREAEADYGELQDVASLDDRQIIERVRSLCRKAGVVGGVEVRDRG